MHYVRSDAAVLYIARRYYSIVAAIVETMPASVTSQFRKIAPLFTRIFADGIGAAEDPGSGESFGMHRCRLVAEGIVDAWLQGRISREDRMAAVAQRFAMNGLTLDHPYLNSGSMDFDIHEPQVEMAA